MFAVVRIRGEIGIRPAIKSTLKMLKLTRVNQCVLIPDTPSMKGMLVNAKDYITWGEVSQETVTKLLAKRVKKEGKKLSEKEVKDASASVLESGLKKSGLNPILRLSPPSGGYKATKMHFPKGDLGYRGEEINKLLEKMI